MAGLYKWQKNADGTMMQVFIILTTRANALMAAIHHRMPVVLDEFRLNDWMAPTGNNEEALRAMLVPALDGCLAADPASPFVNSVKNDGPDLLGSLLG